jgi:hypothetical protein
MLCLGTAARAQYTDYIGAGQDDDIVATASSEDVDSPTFGAFAQNSVNGSGLTGDTHSTAWEDSWTGLGTDESPNSARGDSVWIHYDLGHVYGLGLMHVWNGNEETGRGPSNVTIDYSVDGTNWTELGTFDDWPEATGSNDYTGFEGPDFAGVSARYVLITVNSTHGQDGYWTAISEIKIEAGAARASITVDSNDIPVYEPQDAGGPPVMGPTEGQLLVNLTWKPGKDLGYPPFICTVTLEPNEVGPNDDFTFEGAAADGSVTLSFTEANWSTPQQVDVEAVQDLDREGDERYPIGVTFSINIADANFTTDPCQPIIPIVGVVDNDIPFVVAVPPAIEGQLSENNPFVPYCFDVTLSHEPTDDVYVIVVRDSEYDILLESMSIMDPPLSSTDDPNKLKFTTGNYNTPQQICLEARDDPCTAEPWEEWITGVVILTPYSEDVRYLMPWLNPDGTDADNLETEEEETSGGEAEEAFVDFDVQDNDCGAIGFAPVDFNEDCRVRLDDFADYYSQWLICTKPYEDDCDALWNLEE